MKKTILAANWKMYLNEINSITFIKKLNSHKELLSDKDIVLFPSHTCIRAVKDTLALDNVRVGMQDCNVFTEPFAMTGGVSLKSIDVDYCIVGHSETRYKTIVKVGDDNGLMGVKINNVLAFGGIKGIFCVGETKDEKLKGLTQDVIEKQLSVLGGETATFADNNLTIAYEPVWSIGTGKIPTNNEIAQVLSFIKERLNSLCPGANVKLFYGGSVNENNVDELLKIDLIDGFLIGSASANFDSFLEIIKKIK